MLAESERLKILDKMQHYCAYQERCHKEVRTKLLKLEVYGDDLEEVIMSLVEEDFLNEERFARAFARGKFRLKSWGRMRIMNELRMRDISDYCQRKAMTEIDDEDYLQTAEKLIVKFIKEYDHLNPFQRKQKVVQRMASRGFEFELSNRLLSKFVKSS